MLGVGWTEMLVIGVVALIVIGPRELPALMQRMGKVIGTIRRMGQDFQREINKTTGLDTVTDLRKSITEPLKKTTAEIRKEFNAIGANGTVKPTGAIKPTDPKVESVVDSIKQQAGISTTGPAATPAAPSSVAPAAPLKTGATAMPADPTMPPGLEPPPPVPIRAAVLPKVPAQPTAPVATADLPTIEATQAVPTPEPVAKTPRKRTAKPKPVDSPAPIEAIAPAGDKPVRKPRKKAAPKTAELDLEPEADKPAEGA